MTEPARYSSTTIASSSAPRDSADSEQLTRTAEHRRRRPGWRSRDIMRTAALVIAMAIAAQLVWRANPLLLTAFIGVLFGLAVASGVDFLQRWGVPRAVGAPVIVFGFIGLLVAFGVSLAPTLRRQSIELQYKLPESLDRIDVWLSGHQGGLISTVLGSGNAAAGTQGGQPSENANTLRARLGGQLTGATRYLFPFLSSTIEFFAGLLLIVFLSIYIAIDPELYRRGLMHLFPHRARTRAGQVLSAVALVLRRWLVAQLIGMTVIGIAVTIALLVLRVRAAFALGVLSALFEFIPTIGPIISAVPAIAMGFLDAPQKALVVLVVFWVIHVLESHILIPLLMKGSLHLPPALTILVQALMAVLFGFIGLLTAVPLLAAVMVTIKMLYVQDVVGDRVLVPGETAAYQAHLAETGHG